MKTTDLKNFQQCQRIFKTQVQLENQMIETHQENKQDISKQYNCRDCAFQGDSWSILKKHIQSTRHNPADFLEKCFTCRKEFTSYWTLMNHRR